MTACKHKTLDDHSTCDTGAHACRCGESEIRAYREANGYHVECVNLGCSHFVWSAGTRKEAMAEWNAALAAARKETP